MDSLRERVRRFYARWNPENIGNVDNIVASFGDREEVLWEQLARKYGPDAVRLSAQEQVAAAVAAPRRRRPRRRGAAASNFVRAARAASRPRRWAAAPAARGGFRAPPRAAFRAPPAAPPAPPLPPLALHNGVLSELVVTASLPRTPSDHGSAFDGVEAGREARASSRTHEACCARRALVGLSAGGKDHLNVHGGLFSVLNACGPLFQLHASPGVRKAEDTFVLVDRQLLGHLRSTLLLADAPRRPPPQTQRCSAALRATPFWQRAVQRADGLLKAACHVEDDALKRAAALARTDSFAAIRAVDARLAARPEGDRPGAPPRPDPYRNPKTAAALYNAVQALGPESVGDADRGKLGDGDRDDALRVLGRVIRAAKRLDAATSKQKVPRPREARRVARAVDRQLATPRAARVQAHPKRASPSYRRRREKRPRAEAAPRAEEPPPSEPAERDDDDDVVVTGERSAEEARAPRDVVDLTSDEPPAKRVKAEPAPRPLATLDDGESATPPRSRPGPPPRSALKKASSSSRKSARFADAPDAAPGAGAGDGAAGAPPAPPSPRRTRRSSALTIESTAAAVGRGAGLPCSAPPANVRHAEKRRSASTCALADNVARSALAEWRALDASKLPGQTCVAAIVAAVGPRCACLALGAGTKVARRSAVADDARGEVLRDCHAEVLAGAARRSPPATRGGGDFFERRSDGVFDKVARWAALGLEGALLSRFVRIPLGGVVVGRKFSFEHARRAFCCRAPREAPGAHGHGDPLRRGRVPGRRRRGFPGAGLRGVDVGRGARDLDGAAGVAAGALRALPPRGRGRYVALCGALGAAVDAAAPWRARTWRSPPPAARRSATGVEPASRLADPGLS
ncbi:adenosine deaminase [Aureococcus anophagefferens]|nr:adenosine deaminase [Aureococcus anophagefferens]